MVIRQKIKHPEKLALLGGNLYLRREEKVKIDMAYEQTFKNIDNILHTDEGCGSEE